MAGPPPRITVAGYLSLDTLSGPAGTYRRVAGGGALYAALGACAAGARVRLVARCCEDFPSAVLGGLAGLGIDIESLEPAAGATRTAVLVDSRASLGRDTARASPHHAEASWWARTRSLAPTPCTQAADAVVLTAMPSEHLARHIRCARRGGALVIADTSEAFAARERHSLLALLDRLDLFAPSREEVRLLLPGRGDALAQQLLAARCPRVVQKLGGQGLWWTSAGHPSVEAPSRATTVVDTTGAGDATVGALASGLAARMPVPALLDLASRIAARVVGAVGPRGLGLEVSSADIA